ncbi:hypothetical protein J437_LFUL015224 [Ladona fulva]|uniref:Uncharacterized protein n=1 Tax=Ladona fulva TaxID=123851 RepID=A0A8K0PAV6_LADFU|nr:hypothetical protein J437_LFUL015224 [Ladona fulva]
MVAHIFLFLYFVLVSLKTHSYHPCSVKSGGGTGVGQYPAYQVVSPPAISSSSSSSTSSVGAANPHPQVVQPMPVATQVPVVTTQQAIDVFSPVKVEGACGVRSEDPI